MVVMIFSVRQVQEKCREQPTPLYIAFINLKIGRLLTFFYQEGPFPAAATEDWMSSQLLSIIASFRGNMKRTIRYAGVASKHFPVHSGVKQCSVLAPTLFVILFSLLLKLAFNSPQKGSTCTPEVMGRCLIWHG